MLLIAAAVFCACGSGTQPASPLDSESASPLPAVSEDIVFREGAETIDEPGITDEIIDPQDDCRTWLDDNECDFSDFGGEYDPETATKTVTPPPTFPVETTPAQTIKPTEKPDATPEWSPEPTETPTQSAEPDESAADNDSEYDAASSPVA
jgi:hypothetical protein